MSLAASRRSMMKMLGLAPLAVPMAKAELLGLASSPSVQLGLAAAANIGSGNSNGDGLVNLLGKEMATQARISINRLEFQFAARRAARAARFDGFDPDIGCLKSVSRCVKALKQSTRDSELEAELNEIRRVMWW